MNIDTSTTIGRISLRNPVMLASGTCGYGAELSDLLDLESLGAIVVKGISLEPRHGNPSPRIAETPCGLLNAIGLENVGVEEFVRSRLPWLGRLNVAVIVNVLGNSVDEYGALAERLDAVDGIDALEVNISCPNVREGGVAFGTDPASAASVTRRVRSATRLPVIIKLSPNVTDITEIARAVEAEGADAVSLINTLLGMKIDIYRRSPAIANTFAGLSGPAIMPVALRMVWQTVRAVSIPVIGIGGISSWQDAAEFLMAGASAIQVGTATLVNPSSASDIAQGLARFMKEQGLEKISDFCINR